MLSLAAPRLVVLGGFALVAVASTATASPEPAGVAERRADRRAAAPALVTPPPEAAEADAPPIDDATPDEPAPLSTGWPWRGRLANAVQLTPSAHVHLVDADVPNGRHWGTAALVGLVERVGAHVAAHAPGARLQVGELSGPGGGNIPGHRSHENGRDVDLAFYFVDDETGEHVDLPRFANVSRSGTARVNDRVVRFDLERNWRLLEALATDEETPVQHAFVSRSLRQKLLRAGERLGASPELVARVERIMIPPGVRHPHQNHFHVRVYCPADDTSEGCRDRGPYWPWMPSAHPWQARVVPLPGYPPREATQTTNVARRGSRTRSAG